MEQEILKAYDDSAAKNDGFILIELETDFFDDSFKENKPQYYDAQYLEEVNVEVKLIDKKTALQYLNAHRDGKYRFDGIHKTSNGPCVRYKKVKEWQN